MKNYPFILVLLLLIHSVSLAKETTTEEVIRGIISCKNDRTYCLSKTERSGDIIYIYSEMEVRIGDFNPEEIPNYAKIMLGLTTEIKKSIDSTIASVGLKEKTALFTKNQINDIYIYAFRGNEDKGVVWIDKNLSDQEIKNKVIEYGYMVD